MIRLKDYPTLLLLCFPFSVFAKESPQTSMPAVLKADQIYGDREANILNAIGNVELKKDGNILYADKLAYNKGEGDIEAFGDIRLKNYDLGNVYAKSANVKSDFKSGDFKEATIVFNDGSYIKSPQISRRNEVETTFNRPVFSICPNSEIENNNSLAGDNPDAISITSEKTTLNKATNTVKTKHGVIRVYDYPVFYTPYLSTPMPASGRKSGVLYPSYVNNTKLGLGIKVPYYFNIAPNKDLTTSVQYHPRGEHVIVGNVYRHLLKEGSYNVKFDLANNRPKINNIGGSKEVHKEARWHGISKGELALSQVTGIDFNIDTVGDKNYMRDYKNNFVGYTVSEINLDYIKDDEYAGIKAVRTQELEFNLDEKQAPLALPIINYSKSYKPKDGMFNQTYGILLNSTTIYRENGLQYRRASARPEIHVPYNVAGNLFELNANVQGDFYNLENNFETNSNNNYDSTAFNYRPEASLKWSLPLVGKHKTNTVIIEPLVNIAISSFRNNFNEIPNEDSQNTELTQNNLFLSDRLYGFDRNEDGQRVTYGFKSSIFNDKYGQVNFGLGQSWKGEGETQDVTIRGFNDSNKSNIVGAIGYKTPKVFSINYNFQLNESSYRNDVNEITTTFDSDKFYFNGNYVLIRRTATNTQSRKQLNLLSKFRFTKKYSFDLSNTRDMVLDRNINRKYGLSYEGCCVTYGIFISEDNPTALNKTEKSYNINFTIKNL